MRQVGKTGLRRAKGLQRLDMTELAALFVALNLADLALTLWLLEHGGVEVNPLLSGVSDWPSTKMAFAFACAALVVLWNRPRVMRALVIGMTVVVLWNLAMAGVVVMK